MMKNKTDDFLSIIGSVYDARFFKDFDGLLKAELNESGILVLENFISEPYLRTLKEESSALKKKAYRSEASYNVYVLPNDGQSPSSSPRNRRFRTTKKCVADDEVPENSILRKIYNSTLFRSFICRLEGLDAIFPYADPLASININYYDPGDSLEWHFDNADFAITLLIQKSRKGGLYEYVPEVRYTRDGAENYERVRAVLDRKVAPKTADMKEGDLMIFRGNKSIHRVTPVEEGNRVLVTLNYNVKPGIPLSEESRETFFGRTN